MNRTALDVEATAGNPPLTELVDLYLLRCQVEGKSVQTVTAYRYTLGRFLRTLTEDGVPLEAAAVRQEHLYRYLGRFNDLSLDTRHRYFREVRCFFNWVMSSGYLGASPSPTSGTSACHRRSSGCSRRRTSGSCWPPVQRRRWVGGIGPS